MMSLRERLAARIASGGPLRFDAFQAAALYDPHGGYYEREGRVGRGGDFVTGASWHPAFARALLRLAAHLRDQLPEPLTLLDVGAGEGELLAHAAAELRDAPWLRLAGVEASARRRAAAARAVPSAALADSLGGLAPVAGLVVAYELIDALPVRALRVSADGTLLERCVGFEAGAFTWLEVPCQDAPAVLEPLLARGVSLEPGQLLEVRPGAAEMARALARSVAAGLLLIFDYGAPARALYGPVRLAGTLEAFQAHRVSRDVLSHPGSRDITAWVDFTELQQVLEAEGLVIHGLISQARLLLAAGLGEELARRDPEAPESASDAIERNAIAKLVAPGGMGEQIRVLVAERATTLGPRLMHLPGLT